MSSKETDEFHLDTRLTEAVRAYWAVLESQGANQGGDSGQKDYGDRSKVTGGKQMDAFAELLKDLLERCGIERAS
ncbi:MAG: PaeR7I family type II restriction endonuclease, partial [Candidatus Sulfotelmatobacter sp.]